jgi:hypothetical protein
LGDPNPASHLVLADDFPPQRGGDGLSRADTNVKIRYRTSR